MRKEEEGEIYEISLLNREKTMKKERLKRKKSITPITTTPPLPCIAYGGTERNQGFPELSSSLNASERHRLEENRT